jgi:hypothetical protein
LKDRAASYCVSGGSLQHKTAAAVAACVRPKIEVEISDPVIVQVDRKLLVSENWIVFVVTTTLPSARAAAANILTPAATAARE